MENANTGINNTENSNIEQIGALESKAQVTDNQVVINSNFDEAEAATTAAFEAIELENKNKTASEDDDDDGQDHELTEEILAELPIEQKISLFEHLVKSADINKLHDQVKILRASVTETFRNEKIAKMQAFIETGGTEEDFDNAPSQLQIKFNSLLEQYVNLRSRQREDLEKAKQQNLIAKQEILDQMRVLSETDETSGVFNEFKKLQEAFKAIGLVAQTEADNIWQSYHAINNKFYDNLKINIELKELDFKKNLEQKIEICEKAESLILEDSINKAIETLSALHEQWKEIGPVPREQKDEIWERFKLISDKVYDRRRDYYKIINEERKQNLSVKIGLCEKVESLLNEGEPSTHSGWNILSDAVMAIQEEWKKIGFVPKSNNNEVWKRFKAACDDIFTKKNQFYKSLRREQQQNLQAKISLCEQAEALSNSTDWRNTSQTLIELQKQWKSTGGAPSKQGDKLWNRFRTACDTFFQNKQQHFSGQDAQQDENLALKNALLAEIEAFVLTDDNNQNMDELKSFQRRWIEIGHVPFKVKEDLQNKYRKLINGLFDKLKMNNQERGRMKYQNRVESLKNDQQGDKLLRKEQSNLQQKITKFQSDIAIWENNIEFFSNSKNASALRKEIENKIEDAKREIASLKEKIKLLNETT